MKMLNRNQRSAWRSSPIFYRDVPAALGWVTRAFGFAETMRTATPNGGTHGEMTLNRQGHDGTRGLNRDFACGTLTFGVIIAREATVSKIVPKLWYTEK